MKPLTLYEATNIKYGNDENQTAIKIVPISLNSEKLYAVDISSMGESELTDFLNIMEEYKEYVDMQSRMRFNLGTWLDHSGYNIKESLEWKVFDPEQTTLD